MELENVGNTSQKKMLQRLTPRIKIYLKTFIADATNDVIRQKSLTSFFLLCREDIGKEVDMPYSTNGVENIADR